MRVCMAGGHVWWGCVHGRGAYMVGACVEGGGMHVGGHAWHTPPQQILRDMVNERAVRILLECILV